MTKFGIGQGVPRWEDPRLLRGGRRYSDDLNRAHQAYGYVLRSPHANANIASIDTSAAKTAPGVLGVWTGEDYTASGLGNIPCAVMRNKADGSPMFIPPNAALRAGAVKMVGDPVCWVVAESAKQAQDAAELIVVDYEALKHITNTAKALDPDSAQLWDQAPDNVCFVFEIGDKDKTEAAFASAHHVTKLDINITRVSVAPMETRACIGEFDPYDERYTLITGTQGPHGVRAAMAEPILKVPQNKPSRSPTARRMMRHDLRRGTVVLDSSDQTTKNGARPPRSDRKCGAFFTAIAAVHTMKAIFANSEGCPETPKRSWTA